MMSIVECAKSGKKFKRKDAADWFDLKTTGNVLTAEDLSATDWITEDCKITKEISLPDLEAAYVKINEAPPGMGRGAFRELVQILMGITIK